MKPIQTFIVTNEIPSELSNLKELAYNFWWCWNSEARELFIRIDRDLWEECSHNPILLLNKVSKDVLHELAQKPDFIRFLNYNYEKFQNYMKSQTWYNEMRPDNQKEVIAYFSTEYGINESFPNYSGGLGVLSGDHLKSASDIGLPLVGVGLLYQQGYFRQNINQNGWQTELYPYNDFFSMPIIQVKDENNKPILIDVDLPLGKAYASIWLLKVGRVKLYLLDTNIPENFIDEYRDISNQLYGGDRETRIQQEIVLGIGGVRALNILGIKAHAVHINEGHAAFALFERIKNLKQEFGLSYYEAFELNKSSSLFTTHTPVPAGNETFNIGRIKNYFENYVKTVGLSIEEFINIGQIGNYDPNGMFSMTVAGLKLTGYHNGVSLLHGEVSRKMWKGLWSEFPENEIPIMGLTNGIHTQTWVAREFAELFDRYLDPAWRTQTDNSEIWQRVDIIPNEELWREKQRRRVRLVLFARGYLNKRKSSFLPTDSENKINEFLNPDALTIGFARRFATYKRALLLFKDMPRLEKICKNPERPVQIILAGKAHPHDTQGKETIQAIIHKIKAYNLEKHIVFLADYDMVIARMLVKGCDIWLNNPIRPMEASGTSGMKAALNGTLNLSILDGWWDEAYDSHNGFAIGDRDENENSLEFENYQSQIIYDMLEARIIPAFYNRAPSRVPEEWLSLLKGSIRTIAGRFSSMRMVKDYAKHFYFPAFDGYHKLSDNNADRAKKLRAWKERIYSKWNEIVIIDVETTDLKDVFIGKPIEVIAKVNLGSLNPEDVKVEIYYGTVDYHDNLVDTNTSEMKTTGKENGTYIFKGNYACPDAGKQGLTVRILPNHPDMAHHAEMFLCRWA